MGHLALGNGDVDDRPGWVTYTFFSPSLQTTHTFAINVKTGARGLIMEKTMDYHSFLRRHTLHSELSLMHWHPFLMWPWFKSESSNNHLRWGTSPHDHQSWACHLDPPIVNIPYEEYWWFEDTPYTRVQRKQFHNKNEHTLLHLRNHRSHSTVVHRQYITKQGY